MDTIGKKYMDNLHLSAKYLFHNAMQFLICLLHLVRGTRRADMEFVKKFTQARFLKTKFYPKVRKSQRMQDRDKTG